MAQLVEAVVQSSKAEQKVLDMQMAAKAKAERNAEAERAYAERNAARKEARRRFEAEVKAMQIMNSGNVA